jgi:hypothetical protein
MHSRRYHASFSHCDKAAETNAWSISGGAVGSCALNENFLDPQGQDSMRKLLGLLKRLAIAVVVVLIVPIVLVLIVLGAVAFIIYLVFGDLKNRFSTPKWLRHLARSEPTSQRLGEGSPATSTIPRAETEAPVSVAAPGPTSCVIRGSLFRYQAKTHFHRGEDFYKIFVDGAWKWKEQQRFAGVVVDPRSPPPGEGRTETKMNTGHYFATTAQSAEAEIRHYLEQDVVDDYSLLEIEADIDNVLDLTDLSTIRAVAEATWIEGNIWDILADLIAEDKGGGELSSIFGFHAQRQGYAGIRFFSARELLPRHADRLREARFWDEVAEDLEKKTVLEAMQRRKGGLCIIIFSGALLTRVVKRYRFDGGQWEVNPWFGSAEGAVHELWGEFGPDYQATQGRVSYIRRQDSAPTTDR